MTLTEQGLKDVDALPRGEAWTALDERKIMLLAWHMMHELSNSIATVLSKEGLIKTHVPPQHCFGFQWEGKLVPMYTTERRGSQDVVTSFWGERGWYMEDKLGGHLCMIDDVLFWLCDSIWSPGLIFLIALLGEASSAPKSRSEYAGQTRLVRSRARNGQALCAL